MARVVLLSFGIALAACSSNTNRGVTGSVGVGTGVTLTTAGSVTSLQQGTALAIAASVVTDPTSAGVTWSLTPAGLGHLTDQTTTTATYTAPTTAELAIQGATSVVITATSNANAANLASVTLVVLGKPVINGVSLFPANVNVAYSATIAVAGGEAPFTWALTSGALPAGITLSASTSSLTAISGTPTVAGDYSFTLQATDALSQVAVTTVPLTLTVNPQAACLLSQPSSTGSGIARYAFVFSGFRGGGAATHAGSIAIDSQGAVTGIQDYKDGNRATIGETVSSGTCTNRSTNTGVLTLNAASGQLVYDFAATPPDSSGVIHSARLQLVSSGSDSGSGQLTLQDTTAITGAAPSGNFAFGLLGVDSTRAHFGTAGRLTTDTSGNISAGSVDSNASAALTNATLSGTLSPPDAHGRGIATFTVGSQTSTLAYYVVNAGKLFLLDVDTSSGTPRETGLMTSQTGNVDANTFDNGALASPAILSLWGALGTTEPVTEMSLGRLSNGNAAAGTVDAVLDTASHATDSADIAYTSQSYAVTQGGRGTLSLSSGGATRSFAFYLDGAADGYVVEQGSAAGSAGLLEAQFQGPYPAPPAAGVFPDTLAGAFVGGTQYPQAVGPISLLPLVYLNFGTLSSTYTSGSFSIDPASGRGFGSFTETGVGITAAALYVVSPTKMDMLRFGTRSIDGTIEWLVQN